jgi:PKD repeat protein
VLSPVDGQVELAWDPHPGASGYMVYRASLTSPPFQFSLLEQCPAGQTFFTDNPGSAGSVVYKVVAAPGAGSGGCVYPLAARLVIPAFGGMAPVSLRFHPNTVDTALASLGGYDSVTDANSGDYVGPSQPLTTGTVLKVKGFRSGPLVMVGTMPANAAFKFKANKFKLFAVPLTETPLQLKHLHARGLKGSASHSFIFSDGNNLQIPEEIPLLPGHIYGMRIDRSTDIDYMSGIIRQDSPLSRQTESPEELLGGSPDDGTQVVVLYDNSYETKLYKCWNSGKSGAWDGITDNAGGADNVKNAAVVRRGRTMYVKDEAGMTSSTPVTVLAPAAPGAARQVVSWSVSWDSGKMAAAVTIPASAPVGDYQVRAGTDTGNYVTVYVIFDPSFASAYLDANEYRSWVYYDEDWQTIADLKNYLNYSFEGPGYPLGSLNYVYGYRGDHSSESGADGGVFGQRWVEMAMSIHGSGAATPLEAAVHGYQVIGQRITWVSGNGWYGYDGGNYNTFDDTLIGDIQAPLGGGSASELDVNTAEKAALGLGWSNRMPSAYRLGAGACFNFGTCLSGLMRAMGIPSRCQHSIGGDGWTSSFHAWAEAFLENPEVHPLDPNWWNSYWYEVDCNDYYTGHSTSHSEGSISPIVIDGYGDYLVNEYIQCDGMGYDGSFYDNSFKCTPPGSNTGTHTVVPLQTGTTADAEDNDSLPLVITFKNSSMAWQLMNVFVPWDGPARPSGDQYVYDSHHGYALNDTQTGPDGGSGYIANGTNEDDLPILVEGIDQRGLVAGWGWMIYRVPVNGRPDITVQLVEGADKVEILGTLDRNIYSTDRRWDLDYDFQSDASGVLTASTGGGDQLYLWIQLKGFSHSNPGNGQEVSWYTIRVGDSGPYINAQFSSSQVGDFQYQFTDESIVYNDTITGWLWDFDDGQTSTSQNPSHTYATAGYYDVTLTVTGASGASDNVTNQVWAGPNQAPTADFSYATTGGNGVSFFDQSTDVDGTVTGWSWNFGDGNTSTDQNPSHVYASPGTYSVTLTATDNDGATDSVNKSVSVILQYCSSSSSSDTMAIIRVDVGSFSNSSGKSTYTDFSSLIINMDLDETYSVAVDLDDNFWTAYTRIWIDYNRDGDYEDANELVFQDARSGINTGSITVPSSGVVTGLSLGMRVHTDTMNYKEPCDTGSGWGEVEDYTVIIGGSGANIAPNAAFTYGASGLSVTFTDQSSDSDGVIQSWSWDFGDGNTSTQQHPSHTYASDGTYTVELTVTDNGGLSDTSTASVTVSDSGGNQSPNAQFSFTTDGTVAIFSDESVDPDGSIATWSWDFGDGSGCTASNIAHAYTSTGTFTVTLTVTDNDGASDQFSNSVSVSSTNTIPEPAFTNSVNGLNVDFTDESRDPDSDDSIASWSWDFGDGNTSTLQDPSHTYASAGTYTVTLTVTDGNSASDAFSIDVTTTSSNTPPTADFTFSTTDLTADFTDQSTDSDGSVTAWSWDFGDGNTSTAQNPSHTYAAAGTYTVSLTVTDDDDATDNISKSVTVTAANVPPTADFSFSTTDLTADFTDQSTDSDGTIASWSWNFGDGNTSTSQNPSHTYASAGTYSVSLTVTDNDGATDNISKNVTVTAANVPPTAAFTYSANLLAVTFTDQSTDSDGTISSWSWDFGDGNTSTSQNPSHTYAADGAYTVSLTVTDNDGATDNTSQQVTVTGGGGGGEVPDYCPSYSASDSMSIIKVEFGTFTNNSGKSTYTDFTNLTINLQQGQTYAVRITVDDSFWQAKTRIWIDFNRDGDFNDSGEKVFQKARKGVIQAYVTIPSSGVVTGQKLGLRIHTDTMNYKGPCATNSGWGEVEDYAVIIQ